MNGLGGHYTKWYKSDRERQILYDIIYMWNLKNKTNYEYNKKRNRLIYKEQISGHYWGEERREGQYRGRELRGTNQ